MASVNLQRQSLEVFYKKAVFKHFAIFIGKHLCCILFLIKMQDLIKKRPQNKCFSVNIAKISRTCILKNICEQLLLSLQYDCRNYSWMVHPRGLPNLLRWVGTVIYFGTFSHLTRRCRSIDIGNEYVNYRIAWQLFTNIFYKRLIFGNLKNKEVFSFLHSYSRFRSSFTECVL